MYIYYTINYWSYFYVKSAKIRHFNHNRLRWLSLSEKKKVCPSTVTIKSSVPQITEILLEYSH